MLSELIYTANGGGGANPTLIQSWITNGAISYSYTIDPSKTYLFVCTYIRSVSDATSSNVIYLIKNGTKTVLTGTDNTNIGTVSLTGTTLTYQRSSVTYGVASYFIQLD